MYKMPNAMYDTLSMNDMHNTPRSPAMKITHRTKKLYTARAERLSKRLHKLPKQHLRNLLAIHRNAIMAVELIAKGWVDANAETVRLLDQLEVAL